MMTALAILVVAYLTPTVVIFVFGLWMFVVHGLIEEDKSEILDGLRLMKASPVWPVFVKDRYNSVMKGTDS